MNDGKNVGRKVLDLEGRKESFERMEGRKGIKGSK